MTKQKKPSKKMINLGEKIKKQIENLDQTDNNIEQLRSDLIKSIDRVASLYPNSRNRDEAVKGCLKLAQNLLARAKPQTEDFKASIQELNEIANKREKELEQAKEQAKQEAEREAKELETNANNINNLSAGSIKNLAKKAPDYRTKENPFRPKWAKYNSQKDDWNIDPNKLADEIVLNHIIKRLEENGSVSGLVVY